MLPLTPEPQDDTEDGPTPREKLFQSILTDIKQRSVWETRQIDFYRMRHNGIKRKSKPWNNAADLHWPLIDTNIEKLKPLFFQQIVSMDVVATFVPMLTQTAAMTTTAEQWFDYKLREKTNLQDESLAWIDYALQSGRGVIKVTWNDTKKQVQYDAIDPMYVVVPSHTKELQDTDRIVHVMPMSVAAYKRAGIYKSDKATIEKITGSIEDKNDPGATAKRQTTQLREGITHDNKNEKVIVWEVYDRDEVTGKWIIKTFSPSEPDIDLREPYEIIYEHGMAPFVDFAYEVKDKGWYSPRGIAEILAAFEASLCHTWNQKHDFMQLVNKPMFRADREVPNTMNLRAGPGTILPYGIQPVTSPQAPVDFDEDMTLTRSIAEQRVSNPDYGMGQVINTSNRRTAAEIGAINSQSQQAGDLRARMFRMALGKLYKMSWSLLIQYDKADLNYRFLSAAIQVDAQALHDKYHIEPKGGVNEVNKQQIVQRYSSYKQMFANSPWIDQSVLDRQVLSLMDPELVSMAFKDPNLKAQDEQTDEAKNIPTLLIGYPVPVEKGQNYPIRIGVLMQFLKNAIQTKMQLPPKGSQAIVTRLEQLAQADIQTDTNGGRSLAKSVGDFLRHAGLIPANPTAPGQPPPSSPSPAPQMPANGQQSPVQGPPTGNNQ